MATTAQEQFEQLCTREPREVYNFRHFERRHLWEDARRTRERAGVRPGAEAPDFELPGAGDDGLVQLSELRGKPVVVHFSSYS
ncbi:MAG: redoxin domain-containing protein [Bryobacterales bacterium]|nr:redoxin domain-containing protein [Bryobacterales bacterium]